MLVNLLNTDDSLENVLAIVEKIRVGEESSKTKLYQQFFDLEILENEKFPYTIELVSIVLKMKEMPTEESIKEFE